jgi:hypothetical protein
MPQLMNETGSHFGELKQVVDHFREEGHNFLAIAHRSTPNARSTLPGIKLRRAYPDETNSIPPATTGPPTSIAPPCPGTPFTVLNSRPVS